MKVTLSSLDSKFQNFLLPRNQFPFTQAMMCELFSSSLKCLVKPLRWIEGFQYPDSLLPTDCFWFIQLSSMFTFGPFSFLPLYKSWTLQEPDICRVLMQLLTRNWGLGAGLLWVLRQWFYEHMSWPNDSCFSCRELFWYVPEYFCLNKDTYRYQPNFGHICAYPSTLE